MDNPFKERKDAPPRAVGQVLIFHDEVYAYWSKVLNLPFWEARIWVLFYLFRFSYCQTELG